MFEAVGCLADQPGHQDWKAKAQNGQSNHCGRHQGEIVDVHGSLLVSEYPLQHKGSLVLHNLSTEKRQKHQEQYPSLSYIPTMGKTAAMGRNRTGNGAETVGSIRRLPHEADYTGSHRAKRMVVITVAMVAQQKLEWCAPILPACSSRRR